MVYYVTMRNALMVNDVTWDQLKQAIVQLPDPNIWNGFEFRVKVPGIETMWFGEEPYPEHRNVFIRFTKEYVAQTRQYFWNLGYDDVVVEMI